MVDQVDHITQVTYTNKLKPKYGLPAKKVGVELTFRCPQTNSYRNFSTTKVTLQKQNTNN